MTACKGVVILPCRVIRRSKLKHTEKWEAWAPTALKLEDKMEKGPQEGVEGLDRVSALNPDPSNYLLFGAIRTLRHI